MADSKRHTEFAYEDFRRYHEGVMGYKEQYAFERKLQDDSFFAEAFEGFLLTLKDNVDSRKSMEELRERLHERIIEKRNRIIPFWMYAAAAGIMVSLGAGWLVFLSEKVVPVVEQNGGTFSVQEKKQLAEKENDISEKPALKLPEKSVGLKNESREINKPIIISDASEARQEEEPNGVELGDERLVVASQIEAIPQKHKASKRAFTMRESIEVSSLFNSIEGRVVDNAGNGVPGVVVSKSPTEFVTTDSSGIFRMKALTGDSLELASVGYQNKSIVIDKRELGDLELEEDALALNEVVVVGYGVQKKTSVPGAIAQQEKTKGSPVPVQGWREYAIYLAEKARSSTKGNVRVRFTVNADGTLANFKAKGKKELHEEAIRIIREGPAWLPVTFKGGAMAEQVEVMVQFK